MNESASTYTAVRIGDTSDWRLIAVIAETGMAAWLKNIVNPTEPVIELFTQRWERNPDRLLENIENAVYDHPQVLDDFSADIAIVAPRTLWVPEDFNDADESEISPLFTSLYPVEDADIMRQDTAGAICLYSLTPGLKAFLQRTFSGAKIHSHIALMATRFRDRNADMPAIYIDIREEEADIIVFDGRRLLFSATHNWISTSDIQYHLFNIVNVLGLNPRNVQISLSGERDPKNQLITPLREQFPFVMLTMLPSVGVKTGMPLAAMLLARG